MLESNNIHSLIDSKKAATDVISAICLPRIICFVVLNGKNNNTKAPTKGISNNKDNVVSFMVNRDAPPAPDGHNGG